MSLNEGITALADMSLAALLFPVAVLALLRVRLQSGSRPFRFTLDALGTRVTLNSCPQGLTADECLLRMPQVARAPQVKGEIQNGE